MNEAPLYRGFTSQAQIDAQYNAGASVPGWAAYPERWAETSAAFRLRPGARLDVPYGPTLDETLDVFPAARADAPAFVFLHGGYWRAMSSKEFSSIAAGLQALGITTVVVNYSLAPKVTLDEIARQCRAAVAWTLRELGASAVVVGGHSAGGHLSAMCLQARWQEDYGLAADPLAGAVLVSGIYDIAPLRHSYLQPQIRLDDGVIARCSPLFHIRACRTPLLVTWGADESAEFARQSSAFHEAWRAAGNASELMPISGTHHFSVLDGFASPGSVLCRWIARQLEAEGS
ncbi:MAG: alpha/beta hydrolase [Caldimonas sp.]